MTLTLATSRDELPTFIPTGQGDLFAILTRPTMAPRNCVVILLQGGSWVPSSGRNRLWVRLARTLSGLGFHAVRLDYHGVGESSGKVDNYRLYSPFDDDVLSVVDWLEREHGLRDVVLMGTCFGARTALAAARRINGVRGIALFPPPVRDFDMGDQFISYPWTWLLRRGIRRLPRIFDPKVHRAGTRLIVRKLRRSLSVTSKGSRAEGHLSRSGVSVRFLADMESAVTRHIPLLILFGEEDQFYEDFRGGLKGPLGSLLERAESSLDTEVLEGKLHGFTQISAQERLVSILRDWVGGLQPTEPK
jgi:alpha/beta superfamily hydrolase